jgi:hypothetical protein
MFKSLEVVSCVKPGDSANGLIKDKHYTIYQAFKDAGGNDAVELIELDPPPPLIGFLSWRFEKLQEDKVEVEQLEETIL